MQHSSINPRIAALSPYKPGKPVDEVARELGINDIVKLASNENPRGPGEKVQQAIAEAATELSRYPDGGGFAFDFEENDFNFDAIPQFSTQNRILQAAK